MAALRRGINLLRCQAFKRSTAISQRSFFRSSLCLGRSHEEASEYVRKEKEENWRSYGYDDDNKQKDRFYANFFSFSLFFFLSSAAFIIYYIPDYKSRDWATREAYIILNEREIKGLPIIDKNFVDPATIELPSEEDLEGTNVFI